MKTFFFTLMILVPAAVFAAEGHGEHGAGLDSHTIKTIIYQLINVGLLIVGMVYFLKDSVRAYFKEKQATFLSTAEKAQAARRAAEQDHMQIKIQLTKLESTADESIARARAEAADMRNQMVSDAQAMSKRIREEAEQAAKIEVERARTQLREQMITQAAALAEQTIKDKVSREDHQRLQGDFVQNIQGGQR